MERLDDRPIAQAVVFAVAYVVACAALMLANELVIGGREVPWTWYTALWAIFFAPVMLTTIFAAAHTCPRWPRVIALYGISLIVTLAVMEVLWLANARLTSVAVSVVMLCLGIFIMFKRFEGDPVLPPGRK